MKTMLDTLRSALQTLPALLRSESTEWRSVDVLYAEPRVERLWMQWGENRILLHKIWPCSGRPLYHPHPWPSAVQVISGAYAMKIGTASTFAGTVVLTPFSFYEMTDPDGWHSVEPMGGPSCSVMVTGRPYPCPRSADVVPSEKQGPIPAERVSALLEEWRSLLR